MIRKIGIAAAALGAAAVLFGAFGAHLLRGSLDEHSMLIWHTSVDYQMWHALAILAVAGFAPSAEKWWQRAAWTLILGVVLFCASLYALALGAPGWTGIITPFGGLLLIAGWVLTGVAFWCSASSK